MRNASDQQGESERQWEKKAEKNFVHKTCIFFFRLLDPLIFLPFSLLQSFSITRFHFLFE